MVSGDIYFQITNLTRRIRLWPLASSLIHMATCEQNNVTQRINAKKLKAFGHTAALVCDERQASCWQASETGSETQGPQPGSSKPSGRARMEDERAYRRDRLQSIAEWDRGRPSVEDRRSTDCKQRAAVFSRLSDGPLALSSDKSPAKKTRDQKIDSLL